MIYVGVDPGMKGGFAALSDGPLPASVVLPPFANGVNTSNLNAAAYYWNNDLFVEKMA